MSHLQYPPLSCIWHVDEFLLQPWEAERGEEKEFKADCGSRGGARQQAADGGSGNSATQVRSFVFVPG